MKTPTAKFSNGNGVGSGVAWRRSATAAVVSPCCTTLPTRILPICGKQESRRLREEWREFAAGMDAILDRKDESG